ncbi:hypothetical protein ACTI_28710 [Actinoplanes sp. OR16]|uniref:permease-like cell division protein FtsX n=1 Tax=Actinoplanes sp. OR16 TaxID=946334 RepID=UPI000F6E726C|nr:permease-like cell division protein FtsX [Actinoplanes sp. OR16]BBH66186.1 hypothetical protein ACTI_28710 [Actinoplanes sp. OR16]
MPEHLKELFDRALDGEPAFLDGEAAAQVMAQGRGIRRRRRALAIGGTAAAAVVAVVAVPGLLPGPTGPPLPPPQPPPAVALVAQARPECTWPVTSAATDVVITLRQDITEQQREALRVDLSADPRIRTMAYETRKEAYERFQELWRDSPDFHQALSVPDSFQLRLTSPQQYAEVAAAYSGRPGVEYLVGGVCP